MSAPLQVEEQGKVVRTICILQGPAPNTNGSQSCQIIVPGTQLGRTNDVYVTVLDASHEVVPAGKMLGMVSTTAETAEPEKEVIPGLSHCAIVDSSLNLQSTAGLDLLGGREGNILFRFTEVVPYLVPKAGTGDDGIFLTESYDATSHFETACLDVLALYQRATGEALDLDSMAIESAADDE